MAKGGDRKKGRDIKACTAYKNSMNREFNKARKCVHAVREYNDPTAKKYLENLHPSVKTRVKREMDLTTNQFLANI